MIKVAPSLAACVLFHFPPAAAVAADPATSASLETRIEAAARAVLLEQARDAALRNPSVEAHVVTNSPAVACASDVAIDAVDTRSASRMRFAVACDPAAEAKTEFIVRGALSADVVVATVDLKANRAIDTAQVALARRDVASGAQVTSDIAAVVGKSSRRTVRTGQLIDTRWLLEPLLVQRGANVTIVARNAGVAVTVAGVATEPGRRGAIIAVRNTVTGKVIQARVIGTDEVEPVRESTSRPQ